MQYYKRICETTNDKGFLISTKENLYDYISEDKDFYVSIYLYNEEQFKQFQESGSVAGIRDVITNSIWFDFDNENNLSVARNSAVEVCNRLLDLGVKKENLQIAFSGNKGFYIELVTDSILTPKIVKEICTSLGGDLEGFDNSVYNASRVIRIIGTKHQKSDLFKIPLTLDQLENLDVEEIKNLATSIDNIDYNKFNWGVDRLPEVEIKTATKKEHTKTINLQGLDFAKKAKGYSNCQWAISEGFFEEGDRHNALIVLAAKIKNQHYGIEHCYRHLKATAELQAERYDCERYSDSEIFTIAKSVYEPSWKNGEYTCKIPGDWRYDYCQSLGHNKCDHSKDVAVVTAGDVFDLFKSYADKYEENVLLTGIDDLDAKTKLMLGTSNAILAPPGVGKSSLVLQILKYNSQKDINCLFFSYDMFHSAVYMRMVQNETGLQQEQVYDIFRSNPKKSQEINEKLKEKYKNVYFCFKSGQHIDDLERTISETQDRIGKKIQLATVDYSELVSTDVSDPTASSAAVSQRIRQIANDKQTCMLTLLQPSKQFSSPADEITNYNAAKGSSSIVQSLTLLLGCSRPGFNPLDPKTDKFFNITCLKNRNGPLFSVDLSWDGLKGSIGYLSEEDEHELKHLREQKQIVQDANGGF